MVLILKSTPIVLKKFSLKEFSCRDIITMRIENECTYGISDEQTTFTDTTVPNQQHFKEEVTIVKNGF
jgi:hypothetical protein